MTWHAKALTTSYVTAPELAAEGEREDEAAFQYTTASWYFLDAVEMMMPSDTSAVVAFGDSITDGTASTMTGVRPLARRALAAPPCRLRRPHRGCERQYRRQPSRRAGRIRTQ